MKARPVHYACLLALATSAHRAEAQRPRDTVFIVPGSHLDLGFTASINEVRAQRIAILDHAIALAEHDRGFVWFEEGGWAVESWLDHYHDNMGQVARLRSLVVRGQIGVGATLLSPHAAAFPDALHLLTLHLDRVEHELGRRPVVAIVNDVPALPERIVDVLAAAGIHYLLMGPNLRFSHPLQESVTREPFYWVSARGARVLVAIDPDGYSAGLTRWLLPPDCVRNFDPVHFPASLPDDSILSLGVGREVRRLSGRLPLTIVQEALDNAEPDCVARLDAATARWNRRRSDVTLLPSLPEVFFRHLETRKGTALSVRHGEWGGEWGLLRASEPVWSWRLRRAIAAVNTASPRDLQVAAAMVTDHNVGLGPRWMDGVSAAVARQHVADVEALYRRVVSQSRGELAVNELPPRIVAPTSATWPASWTAIVGPRAAAVHVRAGNSFLAPLVPEDAAQLHVPVSVSAANDRLVASTVIDRVATEQQLGTRYQAVIEFTLRNSLSTLRIAPLDSPDGLAGRWLTGVPPGVIVSPAGVQVSGPGWTLRAQGPLIIGWALVPDPHDRSISRLQALAVVHAVEGTVSGGQSLRLPFAAMYPGEPPRPQFDIELVREPAHP